MVNRHTWNLPAQTAAQASSLSPAGTQGKWNLVIKEEFCDNNSIFWLFINQHIDAGFTRWELNSLPLNNNSPSHKFHIRRFYVYLMWKGQFLSFLQQTPETHTLTYNTHPAICLYSIYCMCECTCVCVACVTWVAVSSDPHGGWSVRD